MTPLQALAVQLARDAADKVKQRKETRDLHPDACRVCGIEPKAIEDDTCGSLTCREIWLEEIWGRR